NRAARRTHCSSHNAHSSNDFRRKRSHDFLHRTATDHRLSQPSRRGQFTLRPLSPLLSLSPLSTTRNQGSEMQVGMRQHLYLEPAGSPTDRVRQYRSDELPERWRTFAQPRSVEHSVPRCAERVPRPGISRLIASISRTRLRLFFEMPACLEIPPQLIGGRW